jgi:hypothetical protein
MKIACKISILLCWCLLACGQKATNFQFVSATTEAKEAAHKTPTFVIGFVGGFVRHDNAVHSPVQVATRIRADYHSGVYVEVFENRRREQARQEILRMLDTDHDGKLSEEEKRNARIIIYGMSWGGSETIELARELGEDKIPVLLTIQVDSVQKSGEDDRVIPANVAEAINFYQTDGLLHGEPEIKAADASRTRILGNFRYEYKTKPIQCDSYPWYDILFTKPHTEIECDPQVWNRVEALIRAKLAAVEENALPQGQRQDHQGS